jgi:hypothetical protein
MTRGPRIAALAALTTLLTARAPVSTAEEPPWGAAETPEQKAALEHTAVCTDGKSHFVIVTPHPKQVTQLYYGDGKKFFHVPLPPWVVSGDYFFEPRQWAKTRNSNFRGLDMRLFASVDYDAGKQTCAVTCGERTTELKLLDAAARKDLLAKASYQPTPQTHLPHGLARDSTGRYFYVDKGSTPETEKSFRLFVGPKGRMKLQKMTNVVADSEGEIFTTKSGSLKYVTDRKKPPVWTEHGKSTTLTVVPIEGTDDSGAPMNNYQLIYNELGVYLGQRLGNPCDDL